MSREIITNRYPNVRMEQFFIKISINFVHIKVFRSSICSSVEVCPVLIDYILIRVRRIGREIIYICNVSMRVAVFDVSSERVGFVTIREFYCSFI